MPMAVFFAVSVLVEQRLQVGRGAYRYRSPDVWRGSIAFAASDEICCQIYQGVIVIRGKVKDVSPYLGGFVTVPPEQSSPRLDA